MIFVGFAVLWTSVGVYFGVSFTRGTRNLSDRERRFYHNVDFNDEADKSMDSAQ